MALRKIFEVASTVDAKTVGLQYLDALKALGAGQATKIVLPMEFPAWLRPLLEAGATLRGGARV